MKLDVNKKTVTPSIDTIVHPTYKAKIDKSATGLVMDILAKLYTNPLAAAIREYTSNAIDAHTAVGSNKPVEVNLPSHDNQWLTVRDYGKGLTAFDILTVYANFGSSDKRDSDEFIGGFGIGSKSGLAISDAIYVNYWSDGKKNSFVIKRTVDGIVTQFLEENVDAPYVETGTEVKIYVKVNYLGMNYNNAWTTDMYMPLAGWSSKQVKVHHDDPKIAEFINENRIPDSWHEFDHGFVNDNADELPIKYGILVGNVYYDTNVEMRDIYEKVPAFDCKDGLMSQPFILKLDIADTRVSYSREKILWKDSDATLQAIARAMEGLVNDIKSAVNTIKSYDLDIEDYIRRLSALKLNVSTKTKPSAYKSLLLKTPTFDISKPIPLNNVSMRFYHNWHNTLRSDDTRLNDSITLDYNSHCFIVVNDTMKLDDKMNSVRRVIQEIFRLDNDIIQSNPKLQQVYDFTHDRKHKNPGFIIVHASDLHKIPSIYRQKCEEFEQLRKAKNAATRIVTQNNVIIPRSQRVYTMKSFAAHSPTLEPLEQNVCDAEQRKTLLLSHKSKYAFMVMNVPTAPKVIVNILPFRTILCAKTLIDFERMKAVQPNAIVMDDDEITAAIALHLHERQWASQDKFCTQIFRELSLSTFAMDDDITHYNDNWCPIRKMGFHTNLVKDSWRNIVYVTKQIADLNTHKDKEPVLQEILDMMDAMPADTHPHQVTDDLRLLLSLCHAQHTYMYRSELDALIDKVKVQYAREIAHMQQLYK